MPTYRVERLSDGYWVGYYPAMRGNYFEKVKGPFQTEIAACKWIEEGEAAGGSNAE